jgi:hypothetical protein
MRAGAAENDVEAGGIERHGISFGCRDARTERDIGRGGRYGRGMVNGTKREEARPRRLPLSTILAQSIDVCMRRAKWRRGLVN